MAGLRVSGLASGMDIDGIVSELMTAERMPLNKIEKEKIYTEWQRDDYRTMNTALSELDNMLSPLGKGVGTQAAFLKKTVTVSNEDAISVKNVSSVSNFSGTVNKVTQLATPATIISENEVTNKKDSTKEVTLATTMAELMDWGDSVTEEIKIKAINKDGGFDTDPYKLTINSDDTLESVISKINADSGVTVFFDEDSQKFSITAKNTGVPDAEAAITLEGTFFTQGMGLNGAADLDGKMIVNSNDAVIKDSNNNIIAGSAGQNAILTYNGLEIKRTSNTFTINGAEITIKQKTTEPVTFSSSTDVDSIYDTIKNFVDTYNGLIDNISKEISEKKSKGYDPLTEKEREALSEDEIEKWEKLARQGTLYRDSTLSSLLTKMRTSIYTAVEGTSFNNMAKIGIATTKDYLAGGKLEIDEDKLRAAIEEDPNGIYELFMSNGETTDADGKKIIDYSKEGIVRRLRDDLKTAMEAITEKAGKTNAVNNTFTLGKLLDNYDDRISAFEEKLADLEDRYYRQFTAMEKAISQANSQSAMLMNYFMN